MTHPPDDLEYRLAHHPGPEPSPTLRPRILAAVRQELHRGRTRFVARFGWKLVSTAAGVLLILNVALSAVNHAGAMINRMPADVPEGSQDVKMFEGLPEDEARFRLLLVQAGTRLKPMPDFGPLSHQLFPLLEVQPWDTP